MHFQSIPQRLACLLPALTLMSLATFVFLSPLGSSIIVCQENDNLQSAVGELNEEYNQAYLRYVQSNKEIQVKDEELAKTEFNKIFFGELLTNHKFDIIRHCDILSCKINSPYINNGIFYTLSLLSRTEASRTQLTYVLSRIAVDKIGVHTSLESFLLVNMKYDAAGVVDILADAYEAAEDEVIKAVIFNSLSRMMWGLLDNVDKLMRDEMVKKYRIWVLKNSMKYVVNKQFLSNDKPLIKERQPLFILR